MPKSQDIEFIKIELKAGLTFSTIALQAKDTSKISRNTANARKAYEVLLRFIDRSMIGNEELAEIEQSLEKLKSNLIRLGEAV